MDRPEIRGPELAGVIVDANAALTRMRPFRVAALRSLVGFKRLSGRGRDRVDLENLENANGKLPIDEIPGLDT